MNEMIDLFNQIDPSQREIALAVLATLRYSQEVEKAQPTYPQQPRQLTPWEMYPPHKKDQRN